MTIEVLQQNAEDFIEEELGSRFPVSHVKTFTQHPLRESGTIALFSFQPEDHGNFHIFVGDTMPMIYPDLDLTEDELWATHIGLEYFLKMGVEEEQDRKSPVFLAYLKMVSTVFQEQLYIGRPDEIKIEKIYVLKDQKHVVGYASFDGKKYSWIVGDIPHFVYKKVLPPHIIWSLHMGKILLI